MEQHHFFSNFKKKIFPVEFINLSYIEMLFLKNICTIVVAVLGPLSQFIVMLITGEPG